MRILSVLLYLTHISVGRAMLRPDAEVNTRGDAAWFGVITWVQPQDEVRRGKPRLVCLLMGLSSTY